MNDLVELVGIVMVIGAVVVALWMLSLWLGVAFAMLAGLGMIGAANRTDGSP